MSRAIRDRGPIELQVSVLLVIVVGMLICGCAGLLGTRSGSCAPPHYVGCRNA